MPRSSRKRPLKLNLADVKCTICLEILIHPVRLPCKHNLCLSCFETNCELTSFQCPLCRMRLSSWARKAKRKGMLVDTVRWEEIQRQFPDEVRKRQNEDIESSAEDPDSNDSEGKSIASSICQPGEIKIEFDEMLRKLKEEDEKEKLRRERASEEFIKNLLKQEGTSTNESSRSSFKPTYPKRARIEIDPNLPSCSSSSSSKPRSSSVDSSDSITQELSHFKPINAAPLTPPKKLPDGKILKPDVILSKARRLNFDDENAQQENSRIRDIVREKMSKDSSTAKRLCTEEQIEIYPLRENSNLIKSSVKNFQPLPKKGGKTGKNQEAKNVNSEKEHSSKACQSDLDNCLEMELQTTYLQKLEQEKADFQLALQLQDKLNNPTQIPREIDRRKGSGNEYNFRKRLNSKNFKN